MATQTVTGASANTVSKRISWFTACALERGKVAMVGFASAEDDPRFTSTLSPSAARRLATELVEAAAVAEKAASHG